MVINQSIAMSDPIMVPDKPKLLQEGTLMSEPNFIPIHPIFIRYFTLNQKCQTHGGTRGNMRGSLKLAGFNR